MLLLLLLSAADAKPGSADAPRAPSAARTAEAARLREELARLAVRSLWDGVEHTYELLVETGAALRHEDHLLGAQAATSVGDVAAARERLALAALAGGDPEVLAWIEELDARFVWVELRDARELEVLRAGTRPDELAARRFAREVLARTGAFDGMLPYGAYRVSGHTLVLAGPGTFDADPKLED